MHSGRRDVKITWRVSRKFSKYEKYFRSRRKTLYIYIFPPIFFYSSLFLLVGNTTGNVASIFPGEKNYRFFKFHFENETPRRTSMIVNCYATRRSLERGKERGKAKIIRIKFQKNFRQTVLDPRNDSSPSGVPWKITLSVQLSYHSDRRRTADELGTTRVFQSSG